MPGRLGVVTLVDDLGLSGGGAELLAREIVLRLDPDRFDRTLCVSRWSERDAAREVAETVLGELEDSGVRFLGLHRESRAALRAWAPLLGTLRREQVHVLHSHKHGSNASAAVLARLAGTPVFIAHEHTWSFEGNPLRCLIDRRLIAPRAGAMVAVSREDRRKMIEVERIPEDKTVFIPNGINPDQRPTGRDIRAELGIAPGDPVIGTVCVLRPQKALEVLIEATRALADRHPRIKLLIAGEGPERPALEAQIEELGLTKVVHLLGRRTDVPDLLAAFDVAVCSSDFEGSPLSIMEYMEAALPVVSTSVGGVPDLISDRKNGFLVPPRAPGQLADAVSRLIDDPSMASAMGELGANRRRVEFDIGVTVRRVAELYERLWQRHCGLAEEGTVSPPPRSEPAVAEPR